MPLARITLTVALTVSLALAPVLSGTAAPAAPAAKTYANCTAIHRDYSGGIARNGVKYNHTPSGDKPLKGHVKFSTALYDANKKSDRDRDGIACEIS